MSLFQKIRGTIETIFQIGLGGPNIKNNSGVIEARNVGDTGFAIARAATPVGANDVATKAYADALVSNQISTIRFALANTPATQDSVALLPANAQIHEATL